MGIDGQPVNGIRGKAVELLVYLALHRNGAPLSAIMEALWPDATLGRAKERLSTNVAVLRKALRTAQVGDQPPDNYDDGDDRGNHSRRRTGPIPNTGSHYHLDPALVQVDLWTVLDEYAKVAAAGDDRTRLRHLSAAVDAIGGGLAEGKAYDYDWIDTDREHVRRRLVKLYTHLADLVGEHDPRRARALYDDACLVDPLSDELARRAMQAAAAVGDTDAVRHRIATLRRVLDDHDLAIEEETELLAEKLLEQLGPPRRAEP
jgi:two-component SAPR family response regulator